MNAVAGTWRGLALLLVAGTVVLGAGLGLRCPWTPGEAALALAGSEMLATGTWLHPSNGGVPVPLPLLPVWLQAIAVQLTGSTCGGFLLPALLAGLATLALTWDLGRRLAGPGAAAGAVLLLITPQFALAARDGGNVMMVTLLITLSLYGLLRHLLTGPDRRWLVAGSAAAGTSMLAGGPVWLALLAVLPWGLARSRAWPLPPVSGGGWRMAAGAFLVVAVASSLLAGPSAGQGPAAAVSLLPDFWPGAAWTVLFWWLPASALLPWLLPGWAAALGRRDPAVLVIGGWLILAIGPLVLWDGGRAAALLPALPALALLAGPWLGRLERNRSIRRLALGLTLLVPAGLVAYSLWPPDPVQMALDAGEPFFWPFVRWSVLLGLGAAIVFRQPRAVTALIIVFCGTGMLLAVLGRPVQNAQRSGQAVMDLAALTAPAEVPLGLMEADPRWFLTTQRPLVHFGDAPDPATEQARALAWLSVNRERRLLAPGGTGLCFDPETATLLGSIRGRRWYLVAGADATPDCAPAGPSEPAPPVRWDPATARPALP